MDINSDGQFEFLIETDSGCGMEDDRYIGDQSLAVGEC